jgi:hypothetical protein
VPEVVVDPQRAVLAIIPEEFSIDANPFGTVAFSQPIFVEGREGDEGEGFAVDHEVSLGAREQRGGFEVVDVETVVGGEVDRSDLGGCALEVVGVGEGCAWVRGWVPTPARPRVPTRAP